MLRFLSFISFLIFSHSVNSQPHYLKGRIMDADKEGISFVAIISLATGKGTVSNENGEFKINIHSLEDTLVFAVMGFEKYICPLLGINSKELLLIELEKKVFELQEHVVKPIDPIEILEKVVQNLPENLPSAKHTYDAFYRQYHTEDGRPARLIECALNVYHPGNTGNVKFGEMKEKVKVLKIRRSNVYEKNGDLHDHHLNDMLLQNIAFYTQGTVLNPKGWNYYKFKLFYPPDEENKNKVIIRYSYENSHDLKIDYGSLYIDLEDFSILHIDQESIMNINYMAGNYEDNRWKYLKGSLTISFKRINGKMFTDSISYYYKHNVVSSKFNNRIFSVEEYFNLWTGQVSYTEVIDKEHKQIHNLYSKGYNYDKNSWKNYSFILKHPLDKEIVKELERVESLEIQFKKNEKFRFN